MKPKVYDLSDKQMKSSHVSNMQDSEKYDKNQITLLHAICCKILGFNDKAAKLYAKLEKFIYESQCKKMKLKIFAVILVPLQKERRVTEDNLGTFSELVSLYNPSDSYDETIAQSMKKLLNDVS